MVNLSTLNFLIAESDVDISAGELDLSFQRMYNSESKHNATNDDGSTPSVFGNRWTNNLDVHLGWSSTGQNTGIISVYTADGARDDYACEIDIVETCTSQMPGIYDLLGTTNVSGGVACQIQWTQKSGVTYTFNAPYAACGNGAGSYGRLTRVYGRNQSYYLKLAYSWSPNDSNPGNLSQIAVTHQPDGTLLTLTFGQIVNTNITELMSISRPDGQTVNYHYSSGGELVDVDKPGNNPILPSGGSLPKNFMDGNPIATGNMPETYDIESPGLMEVCGPRAAISTIKTNGNPTDGACIDFDYVNHQLSDWYTRGVLNPTPGDSVISSPIQSGPSQGFVQWNDATFFDNTACNPYTGTEMQDQYKHAIVWCFDTSGRVVESSAQVSSSSWLSTSQSWDANNNLTSVTDARGSTTNIAYDTNGNAVEIALPSQNTYPPNRTLRPTYLFDYDSYNNVTFYCDPANNASNGWNPSQSDTLCEQSGSTYYAKFTWNKSDGNEPYGCLTYGYTPSGYQRTITYTGGTGNCGTGLPTTIAGHSYTEADGTNRTPTQILTYGSAGNLKTYNVGDPDNALWQLTYSNDGMHHVVAATDPDGVTSHQCYNPDDSLFYSETAYQYVEDGSPSCPSASQIVSGASAPPFSSAFAYDSDGDVATMMRHHNCPDANSNCTANKAASTNCNNVNVTRGTTCYFYDGLDRMVEVKQPYDTSNDMVSDLYSNPWIVRYLYDLTGLQQSFHDQSFSAYGNLFETEELLPQANATGVTTPPTPGAIVSGTYKEIKATAYDGLDRPVAAYSAMGSSSNYTTQTLTWDTSPLDGNVAGLLGKACNGIGQCQKFDYLPNGEMLTFQSSDGSSPERDYFYDPDGRITKILLSGFSNPQQYTYDPNGNLATSVDASNGSVSQNSATLTHNRYPDGSESSLDVASGTLSQAGLFTYSYRNDGPLQTEVINDSNLGNTIANPGKTTLTYNYTDAGRLSLRSESGVGSYAIPMSIQYQANLGLVHSIEMPQGNTLWQFLFGVENELTSVTDSGCQLPSYTPHFYYSLRGELGGSQSCATSGASGNEANGVSIPWSPSFPGGGGSGTQYTWNNLMAVMTNVQTPGSPSSPPPPASSWSYDQAGRMTSQAAAYPRWSPSPSPVTVTRTYDAENRLNMTTRESGSQPNWPSESVSWGPDGHPIVIGAAPNGGSPNNERLHWNGNQLLFTTHSQNGNTVLDDVKVDLQADILPGSLQVQGYNDLTFYDRGPGGNILGCHNKTGTSYVGFGDGWNWSLGPCAAGATQGAEMPTSTVWTGNPYAATLTVGNGGTIGMPRPDGITEGFDTIQGVRVYDSMSGSWTTPDADAGFVDEPASQKSYLWNENNPLSNLDPTGHITILPQPFAWPNWGEDPAWASWNNYLNLLTIAVVTAHCQGCSNHVSKHYGLTMTCSSGSSQVMGAVESNFSRFGNYSRWGGLESVAFFPPSNLATGSNIPITVTVLGVPQSLSVTVQSMNSQSMTFTTNPGHLLYPASITFAASPSAQGFIDFNINLGGTVTNPLEFAAGGSNFEDAQWNHFLGQVSNFCGAGGGQ